MGQKSVFMDVEGIAPGQNFAQAIDLAIESRPTVLVIIGPRWHQILLDRAAQKQEDYVSHEIESAIAKKATMIPVLVGGATAAQLEGLPPGLADLPFHQAIELRDASFKDDCSRLAKSLGVSPAAGWRTKLLIFAIVAAIVAILSSVVLKNSVAAWRMRKQRESAVAGLLATAQTQTKLSEYEAAYRTCAQAVQMAPADRSALDHEVDAAMLWLENYSVLTREGQNAQDVAAPQLAELMTVLDAGLARASGNAARSADILAHIGWAHWLNRHIAEKEFGPAAEQAFRQALAMQPTNVYANSMLGNWLLQNGGSLTEAVAHFSSALATGQQRPLVRKLQLGGMIYNDAAGVPREAVRALNDMRKNDEPLDEAYKRRFLSFDFRIGSDDAQLKATLAAVPPDEAWQTYLWLDDAPDRDADGELRQLRLDFIQATLLEIQGKRNEAKTAFTALQQKMKARDITGSFANSVARALTH
jgi:tetratricopeptide (TPR) repeat protein